jgi:hypothetical protein
MTRSKNTTKKNLKKDFLRVKTIKNKPLKKLKAKHSTISKKAIRKKMKRTFRKTIMGGEPDEIIKGETYLLVKTDNIDDFTDDVKLQILEFIDNPKKSKFVIMQENDTEYIILGNLKFEKDIMNLDNIAFVIAESLEKNKKLNSSMLKKFKDAIERLKIPDSDDIIKKIDAQIQEKIKIILSDKNDEFNKSTEFVMRKLTLDTYRNHADSGGNFLAFWVVNLVLPELEFSIGVVNIPIPFVRALYYMLLKLYFFIKYKSKIEKEIQNK